MRTAVEEPTLRPSLRANGRAFAQISQFHPELTSFRRDLHANPELGFEEIYTSGRVKQALELCGVDEIYTGIGKTGVVGVIHGRGKDAKHGKHAKNDMSSYDNDSCLRNIDGHQGSFSAPISMLGLRADMDALPMTEHNAFGWKSTKPGLMHGCGHDGHTTMLVGAARYLAETRNFSGSAVLIFQPGEEGFAGAKAMIDDGLFERFPVHSAYAMHNWPGMPPGTVGINPGPMMAAADRITITITGKGGHGAHAYLTVDPVLVAGHIITAVQSIVSRNVKPVDNAVISLCAMQAGDLAAMSVVPGTATLVGTVRTFSPTVQALLERRLNELCSGVAQAFGATASVHYQRIYPATINTPAEAVFAGDVAASIVGEARVKRDMEPSMGAEDFSFMLQAKPGAYMRIGQGDGGAAGGMGQPGCFLHNSQYDFNDEVLPLGAALFAGLVEQAMPLGAQ